MKEMKKNYEKPVAEMAVISQEALCTSDSLNGKTTGESSTGATWHEESGTISW